MTLAQLAIPWLKQAYILLFLKTLFLFWIPTSRAGRRQEPVSRAATRTHHHHQLLLLLRSRHGPALPHSLPASELSALPLSPSYRSRLYPSSLHPLPPSTRLLQGQTRKEEKAVDENLAKIATALLGVSRISFPDFRGFSNEKSLPDFYAVSGRSVVKVYFHGFCSDDAFVDTGKVEYIQTIKNKF